MKKALVFIFIFIFGFTYSQSKKENSSFKTDSIFIGNCKSGTKRAIKHALKNKYISNSYGLIYRTEGEWKFYKFYQKYLMSNYGIFMQDAGGCVVTSDLLCYKTKMKALILATFGDNIFECTREEAKQHYNNQE